MLNCAQSCHPDTFCLTHINHRLSTSRKRESSPEDWGTITHVCVKELRWDQDFHPFPWAKALTAASDVLTQLLQIMTVQSHPWPGFTSSLLSHSRSALSPLQNHFHFRNPSVWKRCGSNDGTAFLSTVLERLLCFPSRSGSWPRRVLFKTREEYSMERSEMCL